MRMLQAFDSLDRDHRGYGTTNSLLVVLESMAYMPGRKSVIFFSEGLPASPAMQSQLQSVIESANRANITVYAVDAERSASAERHVGDTARSSGCRRRAFAAGDRRGACPIRRAADKVIERTEDLMRFDNQGGLARLAEDTGGFLVRDTNEIRRLQADRRGRPLSLPPDVLASERRAGRQVPYDQREGEAARHYSLRSEGLSRGAHVWRLASLQLRGARAGDAGWRHAAECLPVTRWRVHVPGKGSARPDAHRRPRHDERAAVRCGRQTRGLQRPGRGNRPHSRCERASRDKLSQQYMLIGGSPGGRSGPNR